MSVNRESQIELMSTGSGFIAALDQSGGSTPKALANYGVSASAYSSDDEMFDLVHEMRVRIMKNASFCRPRVLGAILFKGTMTREVESELTASYLWNVKGILPFLKIDDGLADENNGVQLMKPIQDLQPRLREAKGLGIFGTKMRSVINRYDEEGISNIATQQFEYAQSICDEGLVPIVEPEINIGAPEKQRCEDFLLDRLASNLDSLSSDARIVFKLTLPDIANHYKSLNLNPKVLRVAALSGGYSQTDSIAKLQENLGMIASFSRALTENLRRSQSDQDFSESLDEAIRGIASASSS